MALSDSTVRAGLTSKFKDAKTFCENLTYQMSEPPVFEPNELPTGIMEYTRPTIDEFAVHKITVCWHIVLQDYFPAYYRRRSQRCRQFLLPHSWLSSKGTVQWQTTMAIRTLWRLAMCFSCHRTLATAHWLLRKRNSWRLDHSLHPPNEWKYVQLPLLYCCHLAVPMIIVP